MVLPPPLLIAAIVWIFRDAHIVPRPRLRVFIAGVLASTLAYAGHFILAHFLRITQLNPWDRVDITIGVGGLMFLAALVGLVGSSFGRSYGRICGIAASVFVGTLWWMTGITGTPATSTRALPHEPVLATEVSEQPTPMLLRPARDNSKA